MKEGQLRPRLREDEQSAEIKALQRLKELGVPEVYGVTIDELVGLATQRATALEQVSEAGGIFRQAVKAELSKEEKERRIKRTAKVLREGLRALQQLQYTEVDELTPRRQALAADVARAQALQEAIELWWWWHFLEQVVEFNKLISSLPEEKSLSDATRVLAKAKAIFQSWPSVEITSSWASNAQITLTKMEDRLEGAKQDHLNVRLGEATYWLEQAETHLPAKEAEPGLFGSTASLQSQYSTPSSFQSVSMSPPSRSAADLDPFAALTCLTRAEAILNDLQTQAQQTALSSQLQGQISHAQERLTNLRDEARQYLVQWLADQRRGEFDRLVTALDNAWTTWRRVRGMGLYGELHDQHELHEFLKGETGEAKVRRQLVDKIRLHLYLDPTASTSPSHKDEWLKALVRLRHDNLQRAQQLLQEVKAVWADEEKRQSHTCRAWQKMREAFVCDPDAKEIQDFHREVEEQWNNLDKRLQDHISAGELEKAKELLTLQVDLPPEWKGRLQQFERADSLARRWRDTSSDLSKLAHDTQVFLDRSDLHEAVRDRLVRCIHDRKVAIQAQKKGWGHVLPSVALALENLTSWKLGRQIGRQGPYGTDTGRRGYP